jgi:hypothetical protein
MDELLQTNIFFFITSFAVIIFTAGFVVLLYFLVPLVRDARDMMAKVRAAAAEVEADFEKLKDAAEEEGQKTKVIADVLLGFAGRALSLPPPRRKRRSKRASAQ